MARLREYWGVCVYTRTLTALSVAEGVTTPGPPKHVFFTKYISLHREASSLLFPHRSNIFYHQISYAHFTGPNSYRFKQKNRFFESSRYSAFLKRVFQRTKVLYHLEMCPFTEFVG